MIIGLEATARRHAVRASLRSVLVCGCLIAPWFFDLGGMLAPWYWIVAVSLGVPALLLLLMPLERVADLLAKKLQPEPPSRQFENVVNEIGIALSEAVESIQTCDCRVANIAMLPCSSGETVVATSGALERLTRHELQALVAAQFAGMRDRWCRLATRAEILWWVIPWTAPLAVVGGIVGNGIGILVAVLAIFIPAFAARRNEQDRDLCADVAAVRTTMDPQSLGNAMRKLADQASDAVRVNLGAWYLPINPFLVFPRRIESATSVNGRSWTSTDEVRMELLLRADRAEALAGGADPRKYTGREYQRRWKEMGLEKD